jgi:hypothetical protein
MSDENRLMAESGEKVRGRPMSAEEYLGHVAYAYVASPADSAEEAVAKALLQTACERLEVDPQEVVNRVLSAESGGRVLPPWLTGDGAPRPSGNVTRIARGG